MTNEERMNLLMTIFQAIFQSKAMNTDITQMKIITNTGQWPGRWFKDSSTGQMSLRGFDLSCNLGDRVLSLRCIEQNPNKTDNFGNLKKYAILARQGQQIMWVISSTANKFLGRIHNGEWHPSFEPATTPAVPNQYDNAAQRAQEDTAYAHIDHDYEDPNFHGVPGTSDYQPHTQTVDEALTEDLNVDGLPEIPNGVSVPDYVYNQIAEMDEPPDWDEYNE